MYFIRTSSWHCEPDCNEWAELRALGTDLASADILNQAIRGFHQKEHAVYRLIYLSFGSTRCVLIKGPLIESYRCHRDLSILKKTLEINTVSSQLSMVMGLGSRDEHNPEVALHRHLQDSL